MNINEFPQQVNQVISIAETILQGQILGIYLYGSATMNGLRPDSDIDILIITKQELSNSIRADLTKQLLKISGSVGCIEKRPLEVTIINQSDIVPLQFPPKCQYMYGEWLRGEMEAGEYPPWHPRRRLWKLDVQPCLLHHWRNRSFGRCAGCPLFLCITCRCSWCSVYCYHNRTFGFADLDHMDQAAVCLRERRHDGAGPPGRPLPSGF